MEEAMTELGTVSFAKCWARGAILQGSSLAFRVDLFYHITKNQLSDHRNIAKLNHNTIELFDSVFELFIS